MAKCKTESMKHEKGESKGKEKSEGFMPFKKKGKGK
jgi:hypothetical protein